MFSFSWISVLALSSYWHALFSPHTLYCNVCMHIFNALTILCISHLLAHHDLLIIQCLQAICYTTFLSLSSKVWKTRKTKPKPFSFARHVWMYDHIVDTQKGYQLHTIEMLLVWNDIELMLLTCHLNSTYVSSVNETSINLVWLQIIAWAFTVFPCGATLDKCENNGTRYLFFWEKENACPCMQKLVAKWLLECLLIDPNKIK